MEHGEHGSERAAGGSTGHWKLYYPKVAFLASGNPCRNQ
jgi:hypothetical protein